MQPETSGKYRKEQNMSVFETIYIIGHTIGSFLLLLLQFMIVKDYIIPFIKKVYHFFVNDYADFKQWQTTKQQEGENKND